MQYHCIDDNSKKLCCSGFSTASCPNNGKGSKALLGLKTDMAVEDQGLQPWPHCGKDQCGTSCCPTLKNHWLFLKFCVTSFRAPELGTQVSNSRSCACLHPAVPGPGKKVLDLLAAIVQSSHCLPLGSGGCRVLLGRGFVCQKKKDTSYINYLSEAQSLHKC